MLDLRGIFQITFEMLFFSSFVFLLTYIWSFKKLVLNITLKTGQSTCYQETEPEGPQVQDQCELNNKTPCCHTAIKTFIFICSSWKFLGISLCVFGSWYRLTVILKSRALLCWLCSHYSLEYEGGNTLESIPKVLVCHWQEFPDGSIQVSAKHALCYSVILKRHGKIYFTTILILWRANIKFFFWNVTYSTHVD